MFEKTSNSFPVGGFVSTESQLTGAKTAKCFKKSALEKTNFGLRSFARQVWIAITRPITKSNTRLMPGMAAPPPSLSPRLKNMLPSHVMPNSGSILSAAAGGCREFSKNDLPVSRSALKTLSPPGNTPSQALRGNLNQGACFALADESKALQLSSSQ
jgi:hypothetical protein